MSSVNGLSEVETIGPFETVVEDSKRPVASSLMALEKVADIAGRARRDINSLHRMAHEYHFDSNSSTRPWYLLVNGIASESMAKLEREFTKKRL